MIAHVTTAFAIVLAFDIRPRMFKVGVVPQRANWNEKMSPSATAAGKVPVDDYVRLAISKLRTRTDDADALLVVALHLLEEGKPEEALKFLHKVTKLDPKYPGIWRLKAKVFDTLGDKESARQCRARGSDPSS